MGTYKIVLTGGPCGGKTESLQFLAKKLVKQDYSVGIVHETAISLLDLDYMPNVNISPLDFQNLLFKIQFLKEYNLENKSDILLCDRGLFDGKEYIDDETFKKILYLNKLDEDKLLSTYDGALYFKSISYEYPNEFVMQRIYETPEIGQDRDKRSKEIWKDKIIPCEYNNLDGFKNKQELIYLSLKLKLEYLKNIKTFNLSDYYNKEFCNFIYQGIDEILDNNNISDNVKVKTKGLVK